MLYLVYGGELVHPSTMQFRDPDNIDIVGVFDNRVRARDAWKGKAQLTVDNAHMRYVVDPVKPEDEVKLDMMRRSGTVEELRAFVVGYAQPK